MYYKLLPFKKGVTISCSLTFRCNLNCSYCTLGCSGKRVKSPESTLKEWKERIETFPIKIKEVYVTGGEPALIDWMPEFVNWLLDRGIFVTLYTNLSVKKTVNEELGLYRRLLANIQKSNRFQILSTFHNTADAGFYEATYFIEKRSFRIKSTEISNTGETHFTFSKPHPFTNEQELRKPMFRIGPDLAIHTSCWEMYHYNPYLKS
jgi:organic radical activating enzyme